MSMFRGGAVALWFVSWWLAIIISCGVMWFLIELYYDRVEPSFGGWSIAIGRSFGSSIRHGITTAEGMVLPLLAALLCAVVNTRFASSRGRVGFVALMFSLLWVGWFSIKYATFDASYLRWRLGEAVFALPLAYLIRKGLVWFYAQLKSELSGEVWR